MKLEVWDSPNSAGIVTDAVRCCKLALNHGIGGPLEAPSSYLMKSPPVQVPDSVARDNTEEFIAELRRRAQAAAGQGEDQGQGGGRLGLLRSSAASRTGGHAAARLRSGAARGRAGARRMLSAVPERFSIAQVTPYPWEQHHEVNRYVERLSDELCGRGHRVVVVAPSDSRELIREGRARVKAAASRPRRRSFADEGCASLVGVGQSLPFRRGGSVSLPLDVSRTIEELLDARGARLRARARAVRAERGLRRAAPLARAERGHVPLAHRAVRVHPGGAPAGGAAVRPPRRAHRRPSPPRATWSSASSPAATR